MKSIHPPAGFPQTLRRLLLSLAVSALAIGVARSQYFTPGVGGSVPNIAPFVENPGQFGGLRVNKVDRRNDSFGGGTRAQLWLDFPPPSDYGATAYRLQRKLSAGSGWVDHPDGEGGFMETMSDSQNNFAFVPEGTYHYRLLAMNGPRDGEVSNEVFADYPGTDTNFAGWSLDESMFLTGVMFPWVGRGLEADFTVLQLSDLSPIEGSISLQWYRVNPATWELIPIPGATEALYATTEADVGGYHLLCRATGDGDVVDGVSQVITFGETLVPNEAYASHFGPNGFRLNLRKRVPSLQPADLLLTYWDDDLADTVEIPVTSVTPLGSQAIFQIEAAMPDGPTAFNLQNKSKTWSLFEMMGGGYMMVQGLNIDPNTVTAARIAVRLRGGRALASARGSVNFGTVALRRSSRPVVFEIRNTGNAPLVNLAATKTGRQAGDFAVTAVAPKQLLPNQTASFRATFRPRAKGLRRTEIRIRSNAVASNPFRIPVQGRGR